MILIVNHDIDPFPQGIYIQNLSSEFGNLESTEGVYSSQAATATWHKDWLDVKSAEVQRGLSSLFSSSQALKAERAKATKERGAFNKYYAQGEPRKSDNQAALTQICQI